MKIKTTKSNDIKLKLSHRELVIILKSLELRHIYPKINELLFDCDEVSIEDYTNITENLIDTIDDTLKDIYPY